MPSIQNSSRPVRIAALSFAAAVGLSSPALIDYTMERLDELRGYHPDLICLPEKLLDLMQPALHPDSDALNGALLQRLRHYAAACRTHIVCSLSEAAQAGHYNTSYLLGRDGSIIGKYRKRHVTLRELDKGDLPGTQLPVFDTDMGRIGMLTCFDSGAREDWRSLADQGAQLIIWTAAYDGGGLLNAYAAEHQYFVATSVWTDRARVIDPMGQEVAESSLCDGLAMADVNLGMTVFHTDFQEQKITQIRLSLGDRVTIRGYTAEDVFTLESSDDEWPVERIKRAFGLMTYREYREKTDERCRAVLRKMEEQI